MNLYFIPDHNLGSKVVKKSRKPSFEWRAGKKFSWNIYSNLNEENQIDFLSIWFNLEVIHWILTLSFITNKRTTVLVKCDFLSKCA